MPWIAPVAAAGAGVISGMVGASAAKEGRDEATRAFEASVRDYEAIGIPSVEAQQIVMEEYKSAGMWTPELEEAVVLGQSEMGNVSTDPRLKEAEMRALSKLEETGTAGGMTLSNRANYEKTMGDINAEERGSREAILQNAQEQGGYGSGTSLAAQLMNQQNASARAQQAGLTMAGDAEERALEAIIGAGNLGSKMRGEDFDEQSKVAAAKDEIARWNAANSQDVRQRNAGNVNQAARENISNNQNLMNSNVDQRNKQQIYNKELLQTNFNNKMQLTAGKANARAGQATNAIQGGKDAAAMWGGIGSAVAQGATAYGQMANENEQRDADRKSGIVTATRR
jgi:hypothetical protein